MKLPLSSGAILLSALFYFIVPFSLTSSQQLTFTRDLSLGATGDDVLLLQQILNKDPYTKISSSGAGSPGQETNYFGALTKSALVRYQEQYRVAILTPSGLASGTGYFGPSTRGHMNALAFSKTSSPSVPTVVTKELPKITSISPSRGMAGTEVVLTGTNFSSKNIVYASFNKLDNIPSYDGKTIRFTVREPWPDDLFVPDFLRKQHKSMQYGFYIENENGKSNTVMFTLDLIEQ